MDAEEEDWELPETVRVQPKSLGRGLPVPPVIPLVAIIGVFIGLAMGYRFAANPVPSPLPISTLAAAPTTPIASAQPSVSSDQAYVPIIGPISVANPPADGLTMDQLLAVMAGPWMRIPSSEVLSARVAHYDQVSNTHTQSTQWVWVIVLKNEVGADVNGHVCMPAAHSGATAPPDCVVVETTQILILDYVTGDFLEAQSWPHA
jgi:hypothetical protein